MDVLGKKSVCSIPVAQQWRLNLREGIGGPTVSHAKRSGAAERRVSILLRWNSLISSTEIP